MRSFFVVAAIAAVKVHAESNAANQDNAYVYAQAPIYRDAYVSSPVYDYGHPTHSQHTREVYAEVAPHHGHADINHLDYSDVHHVTQAHHDTPHYVTVPIDEYSHPRYVEVPAAPHSRVVEIPDHG